MLCALESCRPAASACCEPEAAALDSSDPGCAATWGSSGVAVLCNPESCEGAALHCLRVPAAAAAIAAASPVDLRCTGPPVSELAASGSPVLPSPDPCKPAAPGCPELVIAAASVSDDLSCTGD